MDPTFFFFLLPCVLPLAQRLFRSLAGQWRGPSAVGPTWTGRGPPSRSGMLCPCSTPTGGKVSFLLCLLLVTGRQGRHSQPVLLLQSRRALSPIAPHLLHRPVPRLSARPLLIRLCCSSPDSPPFWSHGMCHPRGTMTRCCWRRTFLR